MDINEVLTVCAVDECRNYSSAAYELNYSPSVVSKHIKKVETELGVQIFERALKGRPVELTDEGKQIIGYFHEIASLYQRMTNRIARMGEQQFRYITVGFLPLIGGFQESEIILQFMKEYPDVVVFRKSAFTGELVKMITSGQAEAVFLTLNEGMDEGGRMFDSLADPDLVVERILYNDQMTLGVSEKHVLADRDMIRKEDFPLLYDETFLVSTEHRFINARKSVGKIQEFFGIPGDIKVRYIDFEEPSVPMKVVENGEGVLVQTGFTKRVDGHVRFIPVEGANEKAYLFLVYSRSNANRMLKDFVACARRFGQMFMEGRGKSI